MSDKVSISHITIAYPDGSQKKMSIKDAKELHKQLNELFGQAYQPVTRIVERVVNRFPDRVIWDCDAPKIDAPYELPQIWCHASNKTSPDSLLLESSKVQ